MLDCLNCFVCGSVDGGSEARSSMTDVLERDYEYVDRFYVISVKYLKLYSIFLE